MTPILRQADVLAEVAFGAQQPLDIRIGGAQALGDVGLGDAELFRRDHGVMRPFHDVEPLVIAVTDDGAERLLRDDFRQDHMVIHGSQAQALGVEAGGVRREGVAAAALVSLESFVVGGENHRFKLHVVGAEEIRKVEFRRRALLHADRGAREFKRRGDLVLLAHHEALAVVVVHGGEVEAERCIARHGPCGVAGEQIRFLGLERGEAVLGRERYEFHLGRIIKNRRGDSAADFDVETAPVALLISDGEAGEAGADAAIQHAALLDVIKRLGIG